MGGEGECFQDIVGAWTVCSRVIAISEFGLWCQATKFMSSGVGYFQKLGFACNILIAYIHGIIVPTHYLRIAPSFCSTRASECFTVVITMLAVSHIVLDSLPYVLLCKAIGTASIPTTNFIGTIIAS